MPKPDIHIEDQKPSQPDNEIKILSSVEDEKKNLLDFILKGNRRQYWLYGIGAFTGIILIAAVLYFLLKKTPVEPPEIQEAALSVETPPPAPASNVGTSLIYGFPRDEVEVLKHNIFAEGNASARDTLARQNLSRTQLNFILAQVPNMKVFLESPAGSKYALLAKKGESEPSYFVFEPLKSQYWVFSIKDSLWLDVVHRKVELRDQYLSAIVDSSLQKTISRHRYLANDLCLLLDSALAWTVDLYHLEKTAKIKMLYQESYLDDELISVGPLKAVWIQTTDKTYAGYRFFNGKSWEYYDVQGKNLQAAFLKAPVNYARISSRYGLRPHPIQNKVKFHYGTDFAAREGSPIIAVADGKVLEARKKGLNGYYVRLSHEGGYQTIYLHMKKNSFPPNVRPGKYVKQGETIGLVGQTGGATGPHVCFHIRKNGKPIDPEKVIQPEGRKLEERLLPRFYDIRDSLDLVLNSLTYFQ